LRTSRLSQTLELIGLLDTRVHIKQYIYRLPYRAVVVDLTEIYFLQIGTQRRTRSFLLAGTHIRQEVRRVESRTPSFVDWRIICAARTSR